MAVTSRPPCADPHFPSLYLRPHHPIRSSVGVDPQVSGPHSLPKRHLHYLQESTNYGHNLPPSRPIRPTNHICRHCPQSPFINPSRASVLLELWSSVEKVLPPRGSSGNLWGWFWLWFWGHVAFSEQRGDTSHSVTDRPMHFPTSHTTLNQPTRHSLWQLINKPI